MASNFLCRAARMTWNDYGRLIIELGASDLASFPQKISLLTSLIDSNFIGIGVSTCQRYPFAEKQSLLCLVVDDLKINFLDVTAQKAEAQLL